MELANVLCPIGHSRSQSHCVTYYEVSSMQIVYLPARYVALCGVLLFALLSLSRGGAQQLATASINGIVTDPSGNAVGNVVVTLTKIDQGTVRTFTTQADGRFSFATLEASDYDLSAGGSSGFARWRQPVHLEVGQVKRMPVRLAVAGTHSTVEVSSTGQQAVDTTTSVVGGVIDARQI
jgi:hypothetical protein